MLSAAPAAALALDAGSLPADLFTTSVTYGAWSQPPAMVQKVDDAVAAVLPSATGFSATERAPLAPRQPFPDGLVSGIILTDRPPAGSQPILLGADAYQVSGTDKLLIGGAALRWPQEQALLAGPLSSSHVGTLERGGFESGSLLPPQFVPADEYFSSPLNVVLSEPRKAPFALNLPSPFEPDQMLESPRATTTVASSGGDWTFVQSFSSTLLDQSGLLGQTASFDSSLDIIERLSLITEVDSQSSSFTGSSKASVDLSNEWVPQMSFQSLDAGFSATSQLGANILSASEHDTESSFVSIDVDLGGPFSTTIIGEDEFATDATWNGSVKGLRASRMWDYGRQDVVYERMRTIVNDQRLVDREESTAAQDATQAADNEEGGMIALGTGPNYLVAASDSLPLSAESAQGPTPSASVGSIEITSQIGVLQCFELSDSPIPGGSHAPRETDASNGVSAHVPVGEIPVSDVPETTDSADRADRRMNSAITIVVVSAMIVFVDRRRREGDSELQVA